MATEKSRDARHPPKPPVQHVAQNARPLDQRKFLEDEASIWSRRHWRWGVGRKTPAEDGDAPGPALQPSVEKREQCRLARAGRTEQHDSLARLHDQADIVQRRQLCSGMKETEVDEVDDTGHESSPASRAMSRTASNASGSAGT